MDNRLLDFLPRLAVPVAVALGLGLLRKYLKPSPTSERKASAEERQRDDTRFRKYAWAVGFAMLAVAIAIGLGGYALLASINRHLAEAEGPASFRLLPSKAIWAFAPGFAALTLTWPTVFLLWKHFGNRDLAAKYLQWSNQRSGFDTLRAFQWLNLLIVLPVALVTILALPMHSTVHNNEIRVREFANRRCLRYPYGQARRLAVADGFRNRDGRLESRATILIDFQPGGRWSSADNGDFEGSVDEKLLAFLKEKTGLSPVFAETESDLPPLGYH
jgi:hypothetical protein